MLIPKDATVIIPSYAIHRPEQMKYTNPDTFDPSRYINHPRLASDYAGSPDFNNRDHSGYGAGRRICPGMHLAERTQWRAIAKILWAFDIELAVDPATGQKIVPDPEAFKEGIAHGPKPFKVVFKLAVKHILILSSEKRSRALMRWPNGTEGVGMSTTIVFLILASYGDGEPTDNAEQFYNLLNNEDDDGQFHKLREHGLQNLSYAAFGLGNSSYAHFNAVIRKVNERLQLCGARRHGPLGEADDGKGTNAEDFIDWKDKMWPRVIEAFGLVEHETEEREPAFEVIETPNHHGPIFQADYTDRNLAQQAQAVTNHCFAPISNSRLLSGAGGRSYIHVELDVKDTKLEYQTGNHLSVSPINSDVEVERFLRVFGLWDKRHETIRVRSLSDDLGPPFPSPCSYESVARFYIDICGPVSREVISTFANSVSNAKQKTTPRQLGKDKEAFLTLTGGPLSQSLSGLRHSDYRLIRQYLFLWLVLAPELPPSADLSERVVMHRQGKDFAPMTLFYGCRKRTEDFLYQEEWEGYTAELGSKFRMYIAFSREQQNKIYVQDLILEQSRDVASLIQNGGHVYVCGDVGMGRGVTETLCKVLTSETSVSLADAQRVLSDMRHSHRYQVRVS
ncbi:hypothetical protein FOWG_08371 [Fusarium oxysporum f. sp. lycopersici MN25]|nr:hypothetical protein FOWG_08371 [Fusarium oxysporum f. sp. lycopersici MN25]